MVTIKAPTEQVIYSYDFTVAVGAAALAAVQVVTSTPRVAGAANMIETARTIIGSEVRIKWSGGADLNEYLTLVRITDTNGAIHELNGEIAVRAAGFEVPTGLASRYLTLEEYVARYGAAETIRLTDEASLRVINGPKLEEAIKDQTDIADAYIGNRYDTPLASVPRVVKSI
ncbi:MAG: DUF1320 family protein, partial [Chloroflexi bacterium]|nr:DUF1320 family protein [Chloroflexota bacterium]